MYGWGMPIVYQPDNISWTSDSVKITYTFPHFSHSRKTLCRGLLFVEPGEPVFLDIPCDSPVPSSVFLCEIHNKNSSLSSLGKHMVTKVVCPHGWVSVQGDCYRLYRLNLTTRLTEDTLCESGEVVNYSHHNYIAYDKSFMVDVNAYRDLNQVLIYSLLWLEDKKGLVLLTNDAIENPHFSQEYIIV